MFGSTLVESSRDRGSHHHQGCGSTSSSSTSSHNNHHNHHHHHHHHYRHQVIKTTKVHQSSKSSRVVTVQEKVIRSRLQLGYSTPTSFINRYYTILFMRYILPWLYIFYDSFFYALLFTYYSTQVFFLSSGYVLNTELIIIRFYYIS